jgi:hypothetical protein
VDGRFVLFAEHVADPERKVALQAQDLALAGTQLGRRDAPGSEAPHLRDVCAQLLDQGFDAVLFTHGGEDPIQI